MDDYRSPRQDAFETLHWAVTRLFVVTLYKPVLRPVLRWMVSVAKRWENRNG